MKEVDVEEEDACLCVAVRPVGSGGPRELEGVQQQEELAEQHAN